MTSISIAIAIPLIPSHRTSRKEVEGELISSFTREQFEMEEVSKLAVDTLLVRYKTVQNSISFSKLKEKRELKEESKI